MGKIVILDEKTANQIAAGEVIERPSSVVKEMTENSIDAGATQITVEIRNGGISYIRITDNGCGMEGDDVEIAFERHATSKMRRIEDLDGLKTMGFRGEALASIASVSHLEVTTKTDDAPHGISMKMEGGRVVSTNQVGCPKGTTFIIKNLFYNTPARYKFLKKDTTEAGYVSDIMERLALAHPEISFKFIQNNQTQLHTPGNHDLLSVIYSIYGKDIAKSVLPVHYESEGLIIDGFVGKPEIARGTRNQQSVFLNGRYIKSRMITTALEEAHKTMLMQNKFPFCVLLIKASPESFDVNVHPQKLEVRFANESLVYSAVYHAVKNTLMSASLVRSFDPSNDRDLPYGSQNQAAAQAASQAAASIKTPVSQPAFKMQGRKESGPIPTQGSLFEPVSNTNTGDMPLADIPNDSGDVIDKRSRNAGNSSNAYNYEKPNMSMSTLQQEKYRSEHTNPQNPLGIQAKTTACVSDQVASSTQSQSSKEPISIQGAGSSVNHASPAINSVSETEAAAGNSHNGSAIETDSNANINKTLYAGTIQSDFGSAINELSGLSIPGANETQAVREGVTYDTSYKHHGIGEPGYLTKSEPYGSSVISDRDESVKILRDAELVGQAFDTYILLQRGDNLYIIDQHAAHERIRYETLKKRLETNEAYSQIVLEPFIIRLSQKELDFVKQKQKSFEDLGFELEEFGPQTIILRSIPDLYDSSFKASDFNEILDRWMETSSVSAKISDEALFMMSCKGALKANRSLSKEEIKGLVEQLCSMENPFTCVHGRPVILTMDKKEFEKRFKRIV